MNFQITKKGMLAEKLHGTDPEDVILDAFKEFDENNTGFIPKVPYSPDKIASNV